MQIALMAVIDLGWMFNVFVQWKILSEERKSILFD